MQQPERVGEAPAIGRPERVLVTGGAGFIGSALVRHLLRDEGVRVLTLDRLTYAGSRASLAEIDAAADLAARHTFVHADIGDAATVDALLARFRPQAIVHLAAETHVDRSIGGPAAFVDTNIRGTFVLLEAARAYVATLPADERPCFRFLHVSTDEVFGSLGAAGVFDEETPYRPSSPYSASKAAADHLVRAWQTTYGLPTLVTNCSNNYGPFQYPEKLIPVVILNALAGRVLPVYGTGGNVRDWLHVEDHARALWCVLCRGQPGETYNVGAANERRNIDIVERICALLDEHCPDAPWRPHRSLIRFVEDRPGHDWRYAIDAAKIGRELGWQPEVDFDDGLARTVRWYLANRDWCTAMLRRGDGSDAPPRLGLTTACGADR